MSFRPFMTSFTLALLAAASAACLEPAPKPAGQVAQEQRLAALKAKGAKAPLVVLPVLLDGRTMKDVGDALGLVLEQQGGFDDVASAATTFTPPAGTAPEAMATLLGEFVKKSSPGDGNALFSEFVVKEGRFEAVHTWIVDRDGALVWSDAQRRGDPGFERVKPKEPLECCLVVTQRLGADLGVTAPSKQRDGRMARLFAEKSGTPSETERKAMTERAAALKKAGRNAKIVVFPPRVGGDLDVERGAALAKLLGGACAATATDVKPAVEIKPSSNEQRTLFDLARSLRTHLAKAPVDADYALIAEYVTSPDKKQVGAVHFVVCTGKGDWVVADFQNSHHDDFKKIAPANPADCDRLVLERLEGYLR